MPSTQQHLTIEDVRNDMVFLKDGSVSIVIETSAVNFGLLFDTEQAVIIESFAGLLNSLSFRSRSWFIQESWMYHTTFLS